MYNEIIMLKQFNQKVQDKSKNGKSDIFKAQNKFKETINLDRTR